MDQAVIQTNGARQPLELPLSEKSLHFGDSSPEILRSMYVFLRKFPAVLALAACWPKSSPRFFQLHHFTSLSLSIPRGLLFLILVVTWNAAFLGRGTDGRNTARMQFLRSQGKATVLGSFACTFELWLGRFVFLGTHLERISISAFLLRSLGIGIALVLLTATIYEAKYRLSTPRLCVIAGTRRDAVNVYKRLRARRERRNLVLGFIHPDPSHTEYLPCDYLGKVQELELILMKNPVELVCLALPLRTHYEAVQEIVSICERIGVPYSFAAEVVHLELSDADLTATEGKRRLSVVDHERAFLKRGIDLIGSLLLLLICAPVMFLIALAIKVTSSGPVFFIQQRGGKNRRCFRMYKFRSMVQDAEANIHLLEHRNEQKGPIFKMTNDPRITPVGRILRMLSLDELPQLFNVLKGEMSLVGPRPLALRDMERISQPHVMRRFSVTPGMTGLWQINGRSNVDFETWVKLDLQYVDRWSLGLDINILLRTLPAVLQAKGAV